MSREPWDRSRPESALQYSGPLARFVQNCPLSQAKRVLNYSLKWLAFSIQPSFCWNGQAALQDRISPDQVASDHCLQAEFRLYITPRQNDPDHMPDLTILRQIQNQ